MINWEAHARHLEGQLEQANLSIAARDTAYATLKQEAEALQAKIKELEAQLKASDEEVRRYRQRHGAGRWM